MVNKFSKTLTILGSTGSIGVQALLVAENLQCSIICLAAHSNVKIMEEQIRKFHPQVAVLVDENSAKDLAVRVRDIDVKILAGYDGLIEAACIKADLVLNAVVGMVGLEPTLAAASAGNDIALANKETLVAGGRLVMDAIKKAGVNLLPVDSEHSAIFQCIQGALTQNNTPLFVEEQSKAIVNKLILTASGGPFFGKTKSELSSVLPREALNHPNWNMGAKISVDSATLMNKGLEFIEAYWLFGVAADKIDIVVHRESIIHSMVEFIDGSVIAQMGVPDMKLPIQYAMTFPSRLAINTCKGLDLASVGELTFHKPDYETFECLNIAKSAISKGGLYPASINGANEEAVKLFLEERISFLEIGKLVNEALKINLPHLVENDAKKAFEQIIETDKWARVMVNELV